MNEPTFEELLLLTKIPTFIEKGEITKEQGNIAVSRWLSDYSDEFIADFTAQEYHLIGVINGYEDSRLGKYEAIESIKLIIEFLENHVDFSEHLDRSMKEVIEYYKKENAK